MSFEGAYFLYILLMPNLSKLTLIVLFAMTSLCMSAKDVVWYDGSHAITYNAPKKSDLVVNTAIRMFKEDMQSVTGKTPVASDDKKAAIRLVQLNKVGASVRKQLAKDGVDVKSLDTSVDAFSLSVVNGQIVIVGSNGRGVAYGLLELSRMAGVSPWVWWGDVVPERRQKLSIDSEFKCFNKASVEYRGVFINDEDWSTRPWSFTTNDPSSYGNISAKTYRRIFELLLRLRANAIWPGMHPGTTAFFKIPGAKAVADSCGIAIGSSHCEPILRNNVDEWDVKKRGNFNYITNKTSVQNYWIERLNEVKQSSNNMFTIGMRGIHDGNMEGVKTEKEQLDGLQMVIDDQQELLRKYIGDPSKQMQVFVPYKEVLQVYEKGLKVPDYVTLMWCDDNYGYMTRLSKPSEQNRVGGGGVYYHLSYWGRPHDYLWLTTTQPGLIYNEMRQAYDHNVKKLWIVNVHDPKVAGYDLELFLDMAWNIEAVKGDDIKNHYRAWLCRQFGNSVGERILPAMYEFYRLCGERKPEFMGWSQTELDKKTYDRGLSPVRNTEFTNEFGGELERYINAYKSVADAVENAKNMLRPELADAYFAAIEYPVLAAYNHAVKILESQKARQLASGGTPKNLAEHERAVRLACAKAQNAYNEIARLTEHYNNTMASGKWKNQMSMHPRDLPVYGAPSLPLLVSETEMKSLLKDEADAKSSGNNGEADAKGWSATVPASDDFILIKANEFSSSTKDINVVDMLGHSMKAVALSKEGSVSYTFDAAKDGAALMRVALIPAQPNDGGDLRFSVSLDGKELKTFSLKEPYRSEQWKQNVLRGQAVKNLDVNMTKGKHTLTIKALDDHVVVDQLIIDYKKDRKYYLIPQ